jgi:DNA-binding transcriptional regulator of glucitol operon
LYSLVVIGWLSPGTQDLLKENLNLKKYLNVVTYENQQLKEALKRQKGYLERSPQTLEKERGEEQDKKGD